ncbi:hypothetical protein F4802DRAFT_573902 [Xylaria palmicola]|nr:hypothetical protein F4802DRAFT_573902 [Xylaria palmicola]
MVSSCRAPMSGVLLFTAPALAFAVDCSAVALISRACLAKLVCPSRLGLALLETAMFRIPALAGICRQIQRRGAVRGWRMAAAEGETDRQTTLTSYV